MRRKDPIGLSQRVDLRGCPWGINSGGVVDPLAGYLVYDKFTDDDATALAGHTPDKDSEGNGWIDDNAGFKVQNNTAQATTVGKNCSTIDVGTANVDIRITIIVKENGAINEQAGIMLRADDWDNGIFLRYSPLNDPTELTLTKRDGGAQTELDAVAWNPNIDDVVEMKIIAEGDSIKGYLDGVEKVSAINAFHNTVISHGLFGYHSAGETAHLLDNFNVAAV